MLIFTARVIDFNLLIEPGRKVCMYNPPCLKGDERIGGGEGRGRGEMGWKVSFFGGGVATLLHQKKKMLVSLNLGAFRLARTSSCRRGRCVRAVDRLLLCFFPQAGSGRHTRHNIILVGRTRVYMILSLALQPSTPVPWLLLPDLASTLFGPDVSKSKLNRGLPQQWECATIRTRYAYDARTRQQ